MRDKIKWWQSQVYNLATILLIYRAVLHQITC